MGRCVGRPGEGQAEERAGSISEGVGMVRLVDEEVEEAAVVVVLPAETGLPRMMLPARKREETFANKLSVG